MQRSLYIISDLHLGGDDGFQMCPPAGQARLADFIGHVQRQHSASQPVHLLLAGDIVDFLAEQDFSAFTFNDAAASAKLARIIGRTQPVWHALASLAASGARLTLMLGNHDTELCLPGPVQLLRQTLGRSTEFMLDNQAFTDGPVLVEHGNRYDGWNVVSHGQLRAIRSALSRREDPPPYLGPPGSRLVHQAMNGLKADYPWVDLLKPENEAMLPILAVLQPSAMRHVPRLALLADEAAGISFDADGRPTDPQNIAASEQAARTTHPMLALAYQLAGMDDPSNVGALEFGQDLLARLRQATSNAVRGAVMASLHTALNAFAKAHHQAFDTRHEEQRYLSPATASAGLGFRVVVYGHTHLAKRCVLPKGALYLNTGTWADLMALPQAVLAAEADARPALEAFVADLAAKPAENRMAKWRAQLPTFARIQFNGDVLQAADVFVYQGGDDCQPLPDGPLALLHD